MRTKHTRNTRVGLWGQSSIWDVTKRTKWFYTLNDSLFDNVSGALNLLREHDQGVPLEFKVSSRNQKNFLLKNQMKMIFSIRHNIISNSQPFNIIHS